MRVVVWIVEGRGRHVSTRPAPSCRRGAEIVLPHVTGDVPGAAHGAFARLLGRGRPERDPGTSVEQLAAASAEQLLGSAAHRLGRPCALSERAGRVEREEIALDGIQWSLLVSIDPDDAWLSPLIYPEGMPEYLGW